MIRHVVERELRDVVQSRKFAFSFAVCAALVLMSFAVGARNHRLNVQRHEAAVAENLRQLEGLTDWIEVRGHRIFLPPQPLDALVNGVSNDLGRTIEMQGRGGLAAVDSRYGEDPIFAVFRFLDLEFVFQFVLSLFAILLAHDAINGEKERGTLRLVFANAMPRHYYILGKLIGTFTALAVPLLLPILLGCLLLAPLGVSLGGEDWTRLGLVLGAGLLYFAVFVGLSVFVSSVTHRASSSFLLLLVVWVLSTLVVPRTAVLLGGRAVDVLSVDEMSHQLSQLRRQLFSEHLGGLGDFKPSDDSNPDSMMQDLNKFMEERAEARETKLRALRERLQEERSNGQVRQERLAFALARFSPGAAFTLAVAKLAGTSIDLKQHFLDEALAYQGEYGKFMLEKTGMNLGGQIILMRVSSGDDAEEEQPIDPRELPAFRYRASGLAGDLSEGVVDLGILAVQALVLFLAAFVAFLRYDVR